ncbi:hypothetical protein LEN26_014386 [Aphanomyces euteiches]|nr:hypothetical protein LEN26_014386 [Aphanomyces euteiches]KAH9108765.1 hypothetical protein AeMF1_016082 [Aphanomyces euteiches]KAH9196462.1 hypothetical protein AeNC1_001543 [Aphanomyces euteiches]
MAHYHAPSVVGVVKLMASLSAIYMSLSPMSDMTRVRAKIPIDMLPILCMFGNGSLWTIYGVLVDNWFPLVATNVVGVVLSSYYLVVIYTYAGSQRATAAKKILVMVGLVLMVIVYSVYGTREKHENVSTNVGYAGIAVCTVMFASPLASVGAVFKHKSAASLPFTMITAGVACSILWLAFGMLIQDMFVIVPNGVNLALGLFQLALCYVYRAPATKDEAEVEMPKKTANV